METIIWYFLIWLWRYIIACSFFSFSYSFCGFSSMINDPRRPLRQKSSRKELIFVILILSTWKWKTICKKSYFLFQRKLKTLHLAQIQIRYRVLCVFVFWVNKCIFLPLYIVSFRFSPFEILTIRGLLNMCRKNKRRKHLVLSLRHPSNLLDLFSEFTHF